MRRLPVLAQTRLRELAFRIQRRLGRAPAAPIGPPIFIVGCGHSGTTLVLSMLAIHPRLHAISYESALLERGPAEADWFVRQFNRQTGEAGRVRWVEKTPHHIHHIGAILARFADAKVVVMLRDGRDVACSLRDRTGDFDGAVGRWLEDNAAGRPFFEHPAVLLVRYEDLVEDPEIALRRLCSFLGEEFVPELLEHHTGDFRFYGRFERSQHFADQIDRMREAPDSVTGSSHRLHRSWQARQPVFDGRGRWEHNLSAAEKARFKELAGEELIAYGYASDQDW